ncbi:hypothetical protein EXIGLDRAFT_100446 [Exidia glandulosa HHB12029]|uniref:Uncharacterized protein n=1 Tax=Exidia glandulosa HHB12029 TaxID=1314781 RepID=A0A166BHG4_EXIGL|nr:hypothetical protein EXIGLDRAFT_100446 [Exidia glandulosa HHB12029]
MQTTFDSSYDDTYTRASFTPVGVEISKMIQRASTRRVGAGAERTRADERHNGPQRRADPLARRTNPAWIRPTICLVRRTRLDVERARCGGHSEDFGYGDLCGLLFLDLFIASFCGLYWVHCVSVST